MFDSHIVERFNTRLTCTRLCCAGSVGVLRCGCRPRTRPRACADGSNAWRRAELSSRRTRKRRAVRTRSGHGTSWLVSSPRARTSFSRRRRECQHQHQHQYIRRCPCRTDWRAKAVENSVSAEDPGCCSRGCFYLAGCKHCARTGGACSIIQEVTDSTLTTHAHLPVASCD
jgi:hypothetical protein